MNRELATIKTDGIGDNFCKKYGKYLRVNLPTTEDHLQQLEKNYESVYDELPEAEEMKKVLEYIQLFFAEIQEMYPNTREAQASSILSWLVVDGCPVETAKKLSDIAMRIDNAKKTSNKSHAQRP